MGRNNYFQFKQFRVTQEKSAMKVGTDGVLLGAWAPVNGTEKSILDIGAGTGLISLMLAQRTDALITAIEIDPDAAQEAEENVKKSPWPAQIEVLNLSFQEYSVSCTRKFDLIVSNPPYFINNSKNHNARLTLARHNDFLPLHDLAEGIKRILYPDGNAAIIFPPEPASIFIKLAKLNGLHLYHTTEITPKPFMEPHRLLLAFSPIQRERLTNRIAIHNETSDYTDEYKELTRSYYLNF
jgi:tRNA1Val (adenine37-N6)-methyltransferase